MGSSAPGLLHPEEFDLDNVFLGEETGGAVVARSWDSRGSCPLVGIATLETMFSSKRGISRGEILADGTVVPVSWS